MNIKELFGSETKFTRTLYDNAKLTTKLLNSCGLGHVNKLMPVREAVVSDGRRVDNLWYTDSDTCAVGLEAQLGTWNHDHFDKLLDYNYSTHAEHNIQLCERETESARQIFNNWSTHIKLYLVVVTAHDDGELTFQCVASNVRGKHIPNFKYTASIINLTNYGVSGVNISDTEDAIQQLEHLNTLSEIYGTLKHSKVKDFCIATLTRMRGTHMSNIKKYGEYSTDPILARQLINKLPTKYFKSTTTTFIDVACGSGTFLLAIYDRLQKFGHDDVNIFSRIFGVDLIVENAIISSIRLGFSLNIKALNSLTTDTPWFINNMKFDVVVGNPPFQDGNSKNTIYPQFYKTAVTIAKENGTIALITPRAIIGGLCGESVDKIKMPDAKKVTYLNVSTKLGSEFFKGVGSTFCYFILENSPFDGSLTTIEFDNTTVVMLLDTGNFPKVVGDQPAVVLNIAKKIYSGNNVYGATTSDCSKKSIRDDNGDCEVLRTINSDMTIDTYRVNLFNKSHKFLNQPKVLFTIMGRKSIIDYSHNLIGSAEHLMVTVPTTNDIESESLVSILESNLEKYHGIIYNETKDFYLAFIQRIKFIPLTKIWSNEELYEYFNLTEDEIQLIEDTIQ